MILSPHDSLGKYRRNFKNFLFYNNYSQYIIIFIDCNNCIYDIMTQYVIGR